MKDQPTALWMADAIEQIPAFIRVTSEDAAKELRRLHEVNQELYEALEYCIKQIPEFGDVPGIKAALAMARGESHD